MVIMVNEISHSLLLAISCVVVIVVGNSAVRPRDHDDDVDAQPEIFWSEFCICKHQPAAE